MNARKELVLFFSMSLLLLGCYEMQQLYSDRLRVLGKQPLSSFATVVQMDRPQNPIPETVMEEPTDPPTRRTPFSSSMDHFRPGSLDAMMELQKKDAPPELTVDDRYIPIEEVVRNASLLRVNYYANLSYPFVPYQKGDPVCNSTISSLPLTTDIIRKRRFLTINR